LWIEARVLLVVLVVVVVVVVILKFSKNGFCLRARVFYDIGSITYLYFAK
jgi:hypothetical protein